MSEVELTAELLESLDRLSRDDNAEAEAEQAESNLDGIQADGELVKRCVAGEVGAWEELYTRCHPPLLRCVEHFLGSSYTDPNLVDELAARVWYALVAHDGKLLARFDVRREARLGTFLRCIAKDVTARYLRSEHRRRRREREGGKRQEVKPSAGRADTDMSDFLETLTAGEQEFLGQYLLREDPPDAAATEYSSANIWKRASRIRKKIKRSFRPDSREA